MNIAQEIVRDSHISVVMDILYSRVLSEKQYGAIEHSKIDSLRDHFCCASIKQSPEKIYGSASNDFFLRYGLTNLLKNYYLLSELYQLGLLPSVKNILDLGCGPGIFSLAHLLWNMDHPELCNKPHRIVMADGAKEFLTLFETLWKSLEVKEKDSFTITTVSTLSDGTFPTELSRPDMIVFSNSLSEMLRDPRVEINQLIKSLIEAQAVIFIIDYHYDNTTALLQRFTANLHAYYRNISFYKWPYWNDFFQFVDLDKVEYPFDIGWNQRTKIISNVKFLKAILVPRKRQIRSRSPAFAELVMQYKNAWEQHDIEVLRCLFTEDATYQEKQGREPFVGIDRICEYWAHNAQQQTNVQFFPLFITEENDYLKCIWKCKFYRKDLRRWMILNGVFTAKIKDKRICFFEEKFERTFTGDE